jgi:type II secretory pathway pseudopilin PulG
MAKANKQTHVVDDGQVDLDFDEYEETVVTTGGEEAEEQVASGSVEEEEEVEQYSESVQKRINRLTKKMRDAERNEQEAIGYARSVQAESEKIKTRLQQVDHGYMSEYSGRLAAEEKAAEEALKQAVRSADPDATVSSQSRLTAIHVQKAKLEEAKRVSEARQQVQQQQAQVQQQPQQPQQQQQQQQRDPRAEEWARKNKWFSMAQTPQRDVAMTGAARAIHEVLVEEEGFDPTSDEYYDEIDLRIRDMFPDNFSGSEPAARTNGTARRGAQTVAGASRSRTGRTRRQVKLSPSQRSIAAKLGVPESEYAKYVK